MSPGRPIETVTVNPFQCRMWDMHDRFGEEVNEQQCSSLIKSMKMHGQRQPVLGRKLVGDPAFSIELIYGARRMFVARHLGISLVVALTDIGDRDALIEMDVENRVRADISAYERGLSYRRWLREGYFGNQAEVAAALGVSEARVSRQLCYAELPTVVVEAFRSPRDIREQWAVELARHCRDANVRTAVVQRARRCKKSRPQKPEQIYNALVFGQRSKFASHSSKDEVIKCAGRDKSIRIAYRAKAVHVIVPREILTDELLGNIARRIREAVEAPRDTHRNTEGNSTWATTFNSG